MKLMVQSWNSTGTPAYNAEAEETAFLHYDVDHMMDDPADIKIILSDPTGAIAQKYQGAAATVYVGPGKVTIEDPTASDYFFGRITKMSSDTGERIVTLYCQDWLSQLDDEQEDYDMREDLDGAGLRESGVGQDRDGGTGLPCDDVGADTRVIDDSAGWSNDDFNGMYLTFVASMGGKITTSRGPYDETVAGADTDIYSSDIEGLWTDDSATHQTGDNDSDWTVIYDFRCAVAKSTYLTSIDKARFHLTYNFATAVGGVGTIAIYDSTGAAWVSIDSLDATILSIRQRKTIEIPTDLLTRMADADGKVRLRFSVNWTAGTLLMYVRYARLEVDSTMTVDNQAYLIDDTFEPGTTHGLSILGEQFESADDGIWEECPYSIIQPIYKHIASDETPGGLITDGGVAVDKMQTLTCAATVEHTSGLTTRQYIGKTRLEMIKDLALQDKAHFWIALGGSTVTWKSTFNNGAPETLTDTDIITWNSTLDALTVANKFIVQGMRIADNQLESTYSDATSISYYNTTRTRAIKSPGLVTKYDTLKKATALTNRYKDARLIISATIDGNTALSSHDKTLKLGDEVSITSTFLNISAAVYVVQQFTYSSKSNITRLLLHPRASTTGMQRPERMTQQAATNQMRRGSVDNYVGSPVDDII